MINKKNILGWSNLALRLILSFGLIFVVSYFMGANSVSIWMVYITIIATINSIDGLLSQYYVRDIIAATWKSADTIKYCSYYNQKVTYGIISILVLIIVYFALKITGLSLLVTSILLSIYMLSRIVDGRFKAYFDANKVQSTEIILNTALLIYIIISISFSANIEQFIILHLIGLMALLLYKAYMVRHSEGYKKYMINSRDFERIYRLDQDMLRTIIVSFGSGLSINMSLILMEAMIPGGVTTQFLFTYRVAALICEIISIPVIIRIPEITRMINMGDLSKARMIFIKNYKQSIVLCVLCMIVIISAQNLWNNILPDKLHLTTSFALLFILSGWLFERISTLVVQYYLSLRLYTVSIYYIYYAIFITASVATSIYTRNEVIFPVCIFIINIILALKIQNNWKLQYETQI